MSKFVHSEKSCKIELKIVFDDGTIDDKVVWKMEHVLPDITGLSSFTLSRRIKKLFLKSIAPEKIELGLRFRGENPLDKTQ